MQCPYCKKEMKEGILSGDARQGVSWKEGEKKASMIDKVVGSCKVTAAKCGLSVFTIQAHFCEGCKKMIIDTDVTK